MSWRTLLIANPARLSLKQSSVLIEQASESVTVPLEDIAAAIIENPQITITAPLLAEMSKQGIALIICDEKHTPCGMMNSFHQHSRMLGSINLQLGMSVPFRKNCWRLIVRQKIVNQAKCLELTDLSGADELLKFASQVRSGDPDNRESAAAMRYFDSYFGALASNSNRRDENHINAALNYGYSIIRGAVARGITAHGFIPALGIMHHNELNAFNLADDFLEPFRPVVDLWVYQNMKDNTKEFAAVHRLGLAGLLGCDVRLNQEVVALLRAVDVMCASFMTAGKNKDPELMMLPELLAIKTHQYE